MTPSGKNHQEKPPGKTNPDLLTLLINLPGSEERLARSAAQLEKAGLAYERFPAFDGRQLDPETIKQYDPAGALSFFGRVLSGSEVGCYLSHEGAAKHFLASGAKYGLVMEDDFKAFPGAAALLRQLLEWLEARPDFPWHLIHLSRESRRFTTTPICDFRTASGVFQFRHAHLFPVGAIVLLWSRAGAQAFFHDNPRIIAPIDHMLKHWFSTHGKGFSFRPRPFFIRVAKSEIDNPSFQRRRLKKSLFYHRVKFRRLAKNYLGMARHMILTRLKRRTHA